MVKGFYFGLGFQWSPQVRTISGICNKIYCLLQDLSGFDTKFENPKYLNRINQEVKIDLSASEGLQLFTDAFLHSVLADIKEHDNKTEIGVDYEREFGFSCVFKFEENLILSGRVGSSKAEGLNFTFPQEFEALIDWYIEVLDVCIKNTNSIYASMQLKITQITSQIVDLKYSAGLITFFSSSLSLNILDCLSEFELKQSELGIWLILDRNPVTINKQAFETFKTKLLKANDIIRKCDPKVLREPMNHLS